MKIQELQIENFLTIGKASLKLSDKGLVLIQGENKDDDSADSNGAGKSSIPDALCWALFGETARGVKGDSIVNHTAKKNTAVKAIVNDDGVLYEITRYRKHSEHKNRLFVLVDGVDMTKGTDKLTQDFIVKLLGCSLEVFAAAVYAGQEKMPDLPGMTDKELKVLVEEAAGIDKLQKAHEIAREKLREKKTELVRLADALETLKNQKQHYQDEAIAREDDRAEWDRLAKVTLATILADAKSVGDHHKSLDEEILAFDEDAHNAKVEEVKASIASVDAEREKLTALEKELIIANSELKFQISTLGTLKKQLDGVVISLSDMEHKIGKSCGECGKEHTKDDLEGITKATEIRRGELEKKMKEHLIVAKKQKETVESASKRVSDFKASMTDISAAVVLERSLRDITTAHKTKIAERHTLAEKVKELGTKYGAKKAEENPWQKVIDSSLDKVTETLTKIGEVERTADVKNMEVKLHEDAVDVFGQSGVRAHILDTVTPFLNERTSHYLSTLSDGNIIAEWSTLTTTTKGELREKFNIAVSNDKGADSFQGLSGGEKRKVRLSAAMALQDMVASRASKPIELFIADEVDHALDESGLERLMAILNEKATVRGTVLVISHNSLTDWIREQATVTKEGGYSTVSGALA